MEKRFQEKEKRGKYALKHQKWRTTPEEALQYAQKTIQESNYPIKKYPNPQPDEFKPIKHPVPYPEHLREMIIGILLGQAVGDCIGVHGEGRSKAEMQYLLRDKEVRLDNCVITEGTVRFMDENYKLDDWTDDTDQMILILDSLVHNNGEVDINDLAQRMKYWLYFGFSEIGDLQGLGYGSTYLKAVSNKEFLNNPIESTQELWDNETIYKSTDGSVMRTSIVAIPYFWNEDVVVENARLCGIITHPSEECQASVTVTVLVLSKLLQGRTDVDTIIKEAYDRGVQDLKGNQRSIDLLKKHIYISSLSELNLEYLMSHTMKPMACALFELKRAKQLNDEGMDKKLIFKTCLKEIMMEGGDVDTNCAVAGAVLGGYLHCDCIPEDWLKLKHLDWYKQRINGMLRLLALEPMQ